MFNHPFEGWNVLDTIGSGGYGKIFLVSKRVEDEISYAAIKQIVIPSDDEYKKYLDENREDEVNELFRPRVNRCCREIEALIRLKGNKNVIKFHNFFFRKYSKRAGWEILILMDYCIPLETHILLKGFTYGDVVRLGIEICSVLKYCYKKMLHRDIKESNIFIDETGNFKLGDFGVSKLNYFDEDDFEIIGTKGYMAPEVMFGLRNIDKADVYSLGIVLYRLLNDDKFPIYFEKNNSIFEGDLNCPSKGGYEIFEILKRSCERNPDKRFTPEEFYNELNKHYKKLTKISKNYCIRKKIEDVDTIEENIGKKVTDKIRVMYPSKSSLIPTIKIDSFKPKFTKTFPKINLNIENDDDIKLFKTSKINLLKLSNMDDRENIKENELIQKGNFIEFGEFNNKAILWECVDCIEDKLFLISKYILCEKEFDSYKDINESIKNVKWENSSLCKWLNSSNNIINNNKTDFVFEKPFLATFKQNEIQIIYKGEITNNNYIFIPSQEEIENYFISTDSRRKVKIDGECGWYWTRTYKNERLKNIVIIFSDGNFYGDFPDRVSGGVVPAILVNKTTSVSGSGSEFEPYKLL